MNIEDFCINEQGQDKCKFVIVEDDMMEAIFDTILLLYKRAHNQKTVAKMMEMEFQKTIRKTGDK